MNRTRHACLGVAAAAALLAASCGGDGTAAPGGTSGADDTPDAGAPDGPAMDSGKPPADFVPLITADWTLSAGEEGYVCATKTLTETLHVGAIRPLAPPGTHHTVVGLFTTPAGPDDPGFKCGPSFGQFYASGVGTGELVLPAGVGLIAQAGQQLHLNLHVFNTTGDVLSNTSGVEVRLLAPSEVEHEASISFYGPFGFQIPAAGEYSVTHPSMFGEARTVFAIFPHMHRIGSHFTAEVVHGGATTKLWDDDFQFESQEFAAIPPVTVEAGDVLNTTCTWTNTTGQTVTYGDSSNDEMCFTILMSY